MIINLRPALSILPVALPPEISDECGHVPAVAVGVFLRMLREMLVTGVSDQTIRAITSIKMQAQRTGLGLFMACEKTIEKSRVIIEMKLSDRSEKSPAEDVLEGEQSQETLKFLDSLSVNVPDDLYERCTKLTSIEAAELLQKSWSQVTACDRKESMSIVSRVISFAERDIRCLRCRRGKTIKEIDHILGRMMLSYKRRLSPSSSMSSS